MTRIHVAMILRNEMDRHLKRSVESAVEIAALAGGKFIVTDDHSDDGSYEFLREHTKHIQRFDEPKFMRHEGNARQAHYEWVSMHVEPGDWVLSLDADETVNSPDRIVDAVLDAVTHQKHVVLMPLYEFWREDPLLYRTDGYWFGTLASRLFRFENGGRIANREFAPGSEPTYVADHVRRRSYVTRNDLHLLHWGYVNIGDRVKKYERYSSRVGGHGHNDKHIKSIIDPHPTLAEYRG